MIESYSNLYIKENSLNSSNDSIYNQNNLINNDNKNKSSNDISEINKLEDNNIYDINKQETNNVLENNNINAITGINIIDTDTDEKNQVLYYKKNNNNHTNVKDISDSSNNSIISGDKISTSADISIETINNDNNGWDDDADKILEGWHTQLKLLSFIYQWILDRNLKMSNRLHTISVALSTLLGIFSSLKLGISSSQEYGFATDLIMALINFTIALITTISKKYIDDKINDSLRTYIHNIDNFLGEITSEYFKMKKYRTKANVFFLKNNSIFTSLLSKAPNISINDMKQGRVEYEKYLKEEQNFFRKIL